MPDTDSYTGLEIAVIGLAGKFPGASDIDTFWENLKNGVESISFFSDEEMLSSGFDERSVNHADFVKAAGIIEGKEYFDSGFFGYLPDEAGAMDPQIRLFHRCAWEALEDAGYNPTAYEGAIGLYAGAGSSFNWEAYSLLSGIGGTIDGLTASQLRDRSSMAVVVSYKLNLKGPSFTLYAACSTSLAAAHLACQALICGECDIALAGGVTLLNSSQRGYIYREGMILSPDGHCRTFDAGARGLIAGEGAAVTVLKPLDNAVKDGDNIHAVIKGSYVNNDGERKLGYTAPSVEGQAEVIRNALSAAAVEPESITYIEAHGTGTVLGDPIEVEALNNVFAVGKNKEKRCALGALKTNTGHMDTAAGAASLIKTVLALKHRRIPPSLHFNTPNPKIDFENSPFYVNTTLKKWENHKYPLRAGVSSFGIGGTNVHVILEECPETYNKEASSPSREYRLIVFSAKTSTALDRMTVILRDYFKKNKDINLADAAYTLQTGRQVFHHRRMFACKDTREAVDILSHPALEKVKTFTFKPGKEHIPIVFMFSGQGGQYVDMGRELYRNEPLFRQEMDRCFEILEPLLDYDLREILYPGEMQNRSYRSNKSHIPGIDQTEITQPLLFVFEYALAKLIVQWGITPSAMIGYSYGEYVAACLAGVFSPEEALNLVVLRGKLTAALPPGAMLSVPLTEEELLPLLNDELSLAIVNGPSCIVSGSEGAVAAFEEQMKQRKLLCIRVGLTHAAHSARMEAISGEFEKHVGKIPLGKPKIPYISNVSGTWIKENEVTHPGYWSTHLKSTVRFARGLQELLRAAGSIFIEIGPGKALSNFVRQHPAKTADHLVINLVRDKNERKSDIHYLSDRLGRLWLYGVGIDWQQFYLEEKRKKISLPTYPFEKNKYPLGQNVLQLVSGMSGNRGEVLHMGEDRLPEGFTFTGPVKEPEITVERPELVTSYIEPSTPTEQALVEMWQNFFGIGRIGIADDFFELGGDSLRAMTISAKIHQQFDVEILLAEFFANSTIKDLAGHIDSSQKKAFVFIPAAEKKEYYLLPPAQKRLYLLQQMDPGSTVYNMPQFIPLGKEIDRERLERAFERMIQRHESLCTSFHMINEEPVQRVHTAHGIECTVEYHDSAINLIRPFDLSRAPLLRIASIEPGETKEAHHLLMVDMHHIVTDGVSLNILEREFIALYMGKELPGLKLQYKDYAEWQVGEEQQKAVTKQEEYWLNEFSGELPVLNLPLDFQRPVIQNFEGSTLNFYLGSEETDSLKKVSQTYDVTLYMTLLSAFTILLSKLSGQEDIIVGAATAGRRHVDLENIIGMFVSTMALRSCARGSKRFPSFLEDLKEKTLSAFENQEYPFEELVERVVVQRDASRNPIFDVMFVLQNQAEYGNRVPDNAEEPSTEEFIVGGSGISRFDLTLNCVEIGSRLLFNIEYCTKLFEVDTVKRFAGYLKRIISSITRNQEQQLSGIDILSPQEREQLIYDFNDTYGGYSADKTLHELFKEQAAMTPGHTAVIGVERSAESAAQIQITYRELDEKSDRLANLLREKGVQPDTIVGLMEERSIEMIIGILGILKAGGAYLPIDPEYPRERMDYMLKDSNAGVLVSEGSEVSDLHTPGSGHPSQGGASSAYRNPLPGGVPEGRGGSGLAYVIYTSGTTGKPKGTLTMHRNVVRVVKHTNYIDLTGNDRVLQLSNYAFDGSVFDIYGALLNGAGLVLAGKEEVFDVNKLSCLIERESITLFFVTTALFNTLVDLDIGCLKNVRKILFGGERVSVEHTWKASEFLGKDRIMHMYGPTETTVYASSFDIDSIEESTVTVPIGGPISRTSIYILNGDLNPQPIGLKGEMYIGGDGLARGYLNRPELTAEKFVPGFYRSYRTYSSNKIYKTGDFARRLPDGNIEFLGRMDNQVKIRGFRVELEEIENRLSEHREIDGVLAVAKDDMTGDKYLCAYIVPAVMETPDNIQSFTGELKEYLSTRIPGFMIPSHFVLLDRFPLTPGGKIDRKALPEPQTAVSGEQYLAPRDEIEKELVEICAGILGRDVLGGAIGMNDDFFSLGGNSIKVVRLAASIHKAFNVKVPIGLIFKNSRLNDLANNIRSALTRTTEAAVKEEYADIRPVEKKEYYDVSPSQKRLWILSQEEKASLTFNMPAAYTIEGQLDVKAFENVFTALIERHESLRTVFITVDGKPGQKVLCTGKMGFEILHVDLQEAGAPARDLKVRYYIDREFSSPFNLVTGPMLRAKLLKTGADKYIFLFTMHHITCDALSMEVLFTEIFLLYNTFKNNNQNPLKPLRIQYKDYAAWNNKQLQGEKLEKTKDYWLSQLAAPLPVLQLPTDNERPRVMTYNGAAHSFAVEEALSRQLKTIGSQYHATSFMVILTAFNALFYRYTGQTDITVGTPIAGREHVDLYDQIGFYLNTLALRTRFNADDSFVSLLKKVKETTLKAYEYQLYPFDELVDRLGIRRDVSRNPLFDVVVDMINTGGTSSISVNPDNGEETAVDLVIRPFRTNEAKSKFDLTAYIVERNNRLNINFEYNADLFDKPTVNLMAKRFQQLLDNMAANPSTPISDLLLEDAPVFPPIEPAAVSPGTEAEMKRPASYHQERLWFIDEFESGNIYPSSPVYHNIPLLLEIDGELDIHLLEQSIREVIRRHEALRTRIITTDNRPIQEIHVSVDFHLQVKDATRETAVKLTAEETQRPFLLEQGREPLIRGLVIRVEANRKFLLVMTLHHIIVDRYSLEILAREILLWYGALLDNGSPLSADLPLRYVDFSRWQREIPGSQLESLLFYWRWKLHGKLQALELPTDRPRAPIHIYRSGWHSFTFAETLNDKINKEINPFSLLLAAFKILLYRYSGQEEIVVGTGMRNRNRPGTENIIGPIANLVVLRSYLKEGTTFNDLLSRVKKTVNEAGKYQAMPFDRLVLELKPEVDMSRTALFDVLFQYEEDPFQLPQVGNLKINVIETDLGWGKYDLNMLIQRNGDRFSGVLVYNREYFNESTILRFIGHFLVLLEEVLAQPNRGISQFNLLTKEEQRQLLIEWNRPRIDYPIDRTIHRLFEEEAGKTPDHIAVIGLEHSAESVEQMQITYRELNEKSNRLARALMEKGVQPDTIVGMLMERSLEMIIGILGILKAGGAYLPIDPEYPEERIDFMLKDSNAGVLVSELSDLHTPAYGHPSQEGTSSAYRNPLSGGVPEGRGGSSLAYIIYTSGTTGQPKGCMITHKNVISLLKNKIRPFDFNENDTWTMFHQYNFDFSVWEMYGALLYGGKLMVIPRMVTHDPGQYLEILKQEKVSVLNQTPSAFYHLSDAEVSQTDRRLCLRYIIFGGEALNPARLKQWREKYPDIKLINMFGITETTIHVTYKEIGDKEIEVGTGNIGRPISTLTAYVVDRNLNPVPIGVPGELCVGGEGLARGYLNRPQLTAEKFVDYRSYMSYRTYISKKIYKSGDLVKLLENGDMEYLGRIDHQVQIRGFRIELGEIETRLLKHENIKEVVVISRPDKANNGNPYLCAYIVTSRMGVDGAAIEKTPNTTELREHLARSLPEYMIPSYFVQLTRIPLTPNGKVDRRALPEPEEYRPGLQQTYVAPENELETKIAEIWQEVLQMDRVGTRDNFFEVGGNSLKAVQLKSKLEQVLNRSIPVVILFERMTIHSFAEYLTGLEKGETEPELEEKIDRSEAITRAKDSRAKQRLKRKVKSR